jgi:hypothetical protein
MDALAEKIQCPDPTLREVEIGGNIIIGGVGLHKKPLKFVHVPLYSSSSKKVWTGRTNGMGGLGPGHWDRATIELRLTDGVARLSE